MKDKINSIDMNRNLDREKIYSLFKTHSLKVNKEISEKIERFKCNIDFFEFYSNKEIKYLLNIFKLKLFEKNDEFISSFKSNIEQYISCISQIILTIKIFFKTYDILRITAINAKNYLSKIKIKDKIENYNQDYLLLYLESLLKTFEKNNKFNNSSASTLLMSNISSFEDTSKNLFFQKYSNENKINDFSADEMKPIDNPLTPKFESISDEEIENQEKKNSNLNNSIESNFPIKKESVLTLSQYVFTEESFTPENHDYKLNESSIVKQKIKNFSAKRRKQQNASIDKHKNKRQISYETDLINKNNNKNHYRHLLEMINNIYKNGLINSEEKVKLKRLVIKKSKKIEYLYYNIYKNSKNDKNMLVIEVKKIVA